jgi:hypothetical protein
MRLMAGASIDQRFVVVTSLVTGKPVAAVRVDETKMRELPA